MIQNPYDSAGLFSKAFFLWPGALIEKGFNKDLQAEDLPPISIEDDSNNLFARFSATWESELNVHPENASLLWTVLKIFVPQNGWSVMILNFESVFKIYQAVLLGKLIKYFVSETQSSQLYDNGYFISFLLVLCGIAVTFLHHHFFFYSWRLGMQLRITLTTAIYNKAIKLNLRSLNKTATGHIVNLCSQDVEAFQQAGCYVHFGYQPLLESVGVLYVGINEVGLSFLAGFATILLLIPMQSYFSALLSKSRKSTAIYTDERIKLINQALTGARLMKINGWEFTFVDLIEKIRSSEVAALLGSNTLRAFNEAIFFASPVIVGCFTFVTYSRTGGLLSPQKVFTVLTLFNISQMTMTKFFPYAVQVCEMHIDSEI